MARPLTFSDEIDRALERAERTATLANERRASHRRRTRRDDGRRRQQIGHTIQAIDAVMKLLRHLLGRLPYEQTTDGRVTRLYDVSAQLQYERRQLKKMIA